MKKLTIKTLLLMGSICIVPLAYSMEQAIEINQITHEMERLLGTLDDNYIEALPAEHAPMVLQINQQLTDLYDAIQRDAEDLKNQLIELKQMYHTFATDLWRRQPGEEIDYEQTTRDVLEIQSDYEDALAGLLVRSCFNDYAQLVLPHFPTRRIQKKASRLCDLSSFNPSILSINSEKDLYDYVYARWAKLNSLVSAHTPTVTEPEADEESCGLQDFFEEAEREAALPATIPGMGYDQGDNEDGLPINPKQAAVERYGKRKQKHDKLKFRHEVKHIK